MKLKYIYLLLFLIFVLSTAFFIREYTSIRKTTHSEVWKDTPDKESEKESDKEFAEESWTTTDEPLYKKERTIHHMLKNLPGIIDLNHINTQKEIDQYVWTWKITYQSDNCEVVGFISIPIDYTTDEDGSYPCIILNRGGYGELAKLSNVRSANFAYQFHSIVFASQYRGVDGGTGLDEIGGEEVKDILNLTDIACLFTLTDTNRLYMIGFSRGGMMTYRALCEDTRIKRAVVISGVSDLFQTFTERPDWFRAFYYRIGGTPDEVPKQYEKRSAVLWADRIKTPIMLIHGRKDEKVAYQQSQDMYEALKAAGVECCLRSRPDGIHGIIKTDLEAARKWLGLDGMQGLPESAMNLKL